MDSFYVVYCVVKKHGFKRNENKENYKLTLKLKLENQKLITQVF